MLLKDILEGGVDEVNRMWWLGCRLLMGCQSLDDGFVSTEKARNGDDVEGGATSARFCPRERR